MALATIKTCSKCKQETSFSCFCKSSIQKSSLNPSCKECNKGRHRKYRAENKEKISLWHKQYRKDNPEKCRSDSNKSYAKNKNKVQARQKKYRQDNKEKESLRHKSHYEKNKHNPEFLHKQRGHFLKRHYGITIQDYDDIYIEQGGRCAVCGTHQSKLDRSLAVDHCHSTKIVRGLLCHKCNIGIGCFNDDVNLFKNVVKYLEKDGE